MKLNTFTDIVTQPFGTARLLEGFSTLSRLAQEGVTPAQMRAGYPDLAGCSDTELKGFVKIGNMFVAGDARVPSRIFPKHPLPVVS